jgi:hypothetical protein
MSTTRCVCIQGAISEVRLSAVLSDGYDQVAIDAVLRMSTRGGRLQANSRIDEVKVKAPSAWLAHGILFPVSEPAHGLGPRNCEKMSVHL